jgi:hypothetical protein
MFLLVRLPSAFSQRQDVGARRVSWGMFMMVRFTDHRCRAATGELVVS